MDKIPVYPKHTDIKHEKDIQRRRKKEQKK
jgi:hypothetical protein